MHKDIKHKIEARIRKTNKCWVWTGYIHNKDGYGRYRLPNMKWDKPAHRVVYELYKNIKIPDHLTIDHLCLNKICVNPDHLEVVTRSENSRRARVGKSSVFCKRGHRIETVNWKSQRRVCRVCHRSNNLTLQRQARGLV